MRGNLLMGLRAPGFAFGLIAGMVVLAPAPLRASEDVLYQLRDKSIVDSKWGRLPELQTAISTLQVECGGEALFVDGRYGRASARAVEEVAACKDWVPSQSGRIITKKLWSFALPDVSANPAPNLMERVFGLILAHEATDFDRVVWNYGTADPAGVTWGPFGATAAFGNEIRGVIARIDESAPDLIDTAFETETAFVRGEFIQALGSRDGFDLLKIVSEDPARKAVWTEALKRLGEDKRGRDAFLWYALKSSKWLRPALKIVYELFPRESATEIDYAFVLDLVTQTGSYRRKTDASKTALAEAEATKGSPLTPAERRQVVGKTFVSLLAQPQFMKDRTGRNVVFYIEGLSPEKLSEEEKEAWRWRSRYRASDYGLSDERLHYPDGL